MINHLFGRNKDKTLTFERTYPAPIEAVWNAWTDADALARWWGPEKTRVVECRVEPKIDGEIHMVMEATEEMGKYAGTRWPMTGTFTAVDDHNRLVYDAKSWTEGEDDTTIVHTNNVTFTASGGQTTVALTVAITSIGSKAKMAAFGMKWGYRQQLKKLGSLLSTGV